MNLLDTSGAGTVANSKAVIYGSSGEVNATTLQIDSTSISATAAELNTYVLNVALDDISTASSCFVVAAKIGTITKSTSIIDGTITGGNAVISANINGGTDITNTLIIASDSGAATIDTVTPDNNNTVAAGEYIKLTTNGGSTGTVKAVFTIEITY